LHEPLTFTFSARRVFTRLLLILGFLVAAHIATQYALRFLHPAWGIGLMLRLDLEQEISVPTWYSHSLLLVASVLLSVIAADQWRSGARYRRYWMGLAVIFLYLSIDEGASLHELAVQPVTKALQIQNSFLVLAWIIPAAALLCVFFAIYFRFWWNLPARVRLLFAVAAAIYLGGALITESLSSAYAARYGVDNFGMSLLCVQEEGLEICGITVFVYALLRYAGETVRPVTLQFTSRSAS
jgi:hypothetical protein